MDKDLIAAASGAGVASEMPRFGQDQLNRAKLIHERCRAGKANLDNRIIANEEWFRLRHDPYSERGSTPEKVEKSPFKSTSGWLFNTIANKHADAMDNYPRPNLLPREQGDIEEAELLSAIIPAQLQRLDFEKTYSDVQWDKLKFGAAVYGIFWDGQADGGLGEVVICPVDILSLSWDPGVSDLQKSRNVFLSTTHDRDEMIERYPELASAPGMATAYDAYAKKDFHRDDDPRKDQKLEVVDWYYKKWQNGREVVHFCQYCGSVVIYATENDPKLSETGLYDHGKFPFVPDVLYPVKGSPAGFGMIDICKNPQMYIDMLDAAVLENAQQNAIPRYMARQGHGINMADFTDTKKQVIDYTGNPDDLIPVVTKPLEGTCLSVLDRKIEELKENSGNRDATTGGTTAGVTAASAIAAMIETGSKLTRDSSRSSYRAFRELVELDVELIRQFYSTDHTYRIVGDGGMTRFVHFTNAAMRKPVGADPETGEMQYRDAAFDIEITAERSSPYSRMSQNELMLQFYQAGFFNPGNADASLAAIEGMAFDQKEQVRGRIQQNGTLFEVNQQLMMTNQLLAEQTGDGSLNAAVAEQNAQAATVMTELAAGADAPAMTGTESSSEPAHMKRTREQVANSTAPV